METNLLARCQEITGSHGVAAMLYRVNYWQERAKVVRNDEKWVANTTDWWADQVKITQRQARRYLTTLRERDLIVTEQHFFQGKCILHVRLTEVAKKLLMAPLATTERPKVATPCSGQKRSQRSGQNWPEHIHRDANIEIHKEVQQDAAPSAASVNDLPEEKEEDFPGEEGEVMKIDGKGKTVEDIKAQLASSPSVLKKPGTTGALEQVWKQTYGEVYKTFVPAFTVKQRSQLKYLLGALPGGLGGPLLEHSIRYWSQVTGRAEKGAGAWNLPDRPNLDFLVKYLASAIEVFEQAKHDAEKQAQLAAAPPKPKIPLPILQSVAKPPNPDDIPMTKEEFLTLHCVPGQTEAQKVGGQSMALAARLPKAKLVIKKTAPSGIGV